MEENKNFVTKQWIPQLTIKLPHKFDICRTLVNSSKLFNALIFLNQDRDQGALPPQLGAAWRGQGQDHPGGGAYEDCGLAAFWLAHLWWAHKVSDSDNFDHTLWLTIMIVNYRTLERHKWVFQNQIPYNPFKML